MIGNKSPTLQPPLTPPKGGEEPHPASPKREGSASPSPSERRGCASSQVFCRKLSDKEPSPYPSCAHRHSPPFGGAGGGFCISLCKTDSYKGICGTCYSSTPKNDCFLNKVAYLCKQRTETRQQPVPTSPRGRSADRKISPKMFRS